MRVLVSVLLGGLSVVLVVAGVRGSAEPLFASLFGTPAKGGGGVINGHPAVLPQTPAGQPPSAGPNASNPGTQRFA